MDFEQKLCGDHTLRRYQPLQDSMNSTETVGRGEKRFKSLARATTRRRFSRLCGDHVLGDINRPKTAYADGDGRPRRKVIHLPSQGQYLAIFPDFEQKLCGDHSLGDVNRSKTA